MARGFDELNNRRRRGREGEEGKEWECCLLRRSRAKHWLLGSSSNVGGAGPANHQPLRLSSLRGAGLEIQVGGL